MIDGRAPRTIAVLRAGALGDVILTLPAIRALRARFPEARIRAVGYPEFWPVAGALVDEIVSIDAPLFAGLYGPMPSPALRAWLADVDLAIAWTVHDPRSVLEAAGVPALHASPYPPPGVHAAAWLLGTLPRQWMIVNPPAAVGDGAAVPAGAPIIIHPGAGATWKQWPAARFAHIADDLASRGYTVQIVEGPADGQAVRTLLHTADRQYEVIRESSVRALAAAIGRGRLFIGNDSGVTHLAAAGGLPTIALFGPTDPACWQPLGRVTVLRRCSRATPRQGVIRVCDDPLCLETLPVDEVRAAVGI